MHGVDFTNKINHTSKRALKSLYVSNPFVYLFVNIYIYFFSLRDVDEPQSFLMCDLSVIGRGSEYSKHI